MRILRQAQDERICRYADHGNYFRREPLVPLVVSIYFRLW